MKTNRNLYQARGSAFITVIIMMAVMAVLTASIITYSGTENRINERERLVQRTRNTAESAVNYVASQMPAKLYRLRGTTSMRFATDANAIHPPAEALLNSENGAPTVSVFAGLTSTTELTFIDPTDSRYATNTYKGLSVITSVVPVIASAQIDHPVLGSYSSYVEQDLSIARIPLFQFGIFYAPNLEFGPGGDMVVSGPVHTNGMLIARNQSGRTNTVQFKDRVTAVGGFYANATKLGAIYYNNGTADTLPGGTGPLYFQNPAGTVTNICTGSNLWRDYTYSANATGAESDSTRERFKNFATEKYEGNLRTGVHGVTTLDLPGTRYTAANRKNISRALIEPPASGDSSELKETKFSRRAGLYIVVNPTSTERTGIKPDASTVTIPAYSYRCWMNTTKADGTHSMVEVVLPGQPTYGDDNAIRNNLPNRFTNVTAIGSNQVLRIPSPGNTGNYEAYTTYKSGAADVTNVDSMLWPVTVGYATGTTTLTGFSDAYFYDLRRSSNWNGYPSERSTNAFTPRPIAKIDFDLTRFKLAVERSVFGSDTSSQIYVPDVPSADNWDYNILNPSASTRTVGLAPRSGTAPSYTFATFPTNSAGAVSSDPFRIYRATPAGETPEAADESNFTLPWYDGLAVYIHSVDAQDRTESSVGVRNRIDSGVRLWNGRGRIPSLTTINKTGFSIATNDAAYVVGHLNADGSINSSATSTGVSGYSAVYPESSDEKLCSVMADAITVLSQPLYSYNGSSYIQYRGWTDSFSANRTSNSGWTTNWRTTNTSDSNQIDGIGNTRYAGRMPNEKAYTAQPVYATGTYSDAPSSSIKFSGSTTEISACLVVGIVRTTSATYPRGTEADGTTVLTYEPSRYQNSGGAHNFPRLLEDWTAGGSSLYIRGSMVAMFASEVACEPWLGTRVYSAPNRHWGLHNGLRAENTASGSHDVPLEPILINVSRLRFTELSAPEFSAQSTAINGLPD